MVGSVAGARAGQRHGGSVATRSAHETDPELGRDPIARADLAGDRIHDGVLDAGSKANLWTLTAPNLAGQSGASFHPASAHVCETA